MRDPLRGAQWIHHERTKEGDMNGLMITGAMQDLHEQRGQTLGRSRRGAGRRFGRKPVASPNIVGADDGDVLH